MPPTYSRLLIKLWVREAFSKEDFNRGLVALTTGFSTTGTGTGTISDMSY